MMDAMKRFVERRIVLTGVVVTLISAGCGSGRGSTTPATIPTSATTAASSTPSTAATTTEVTLPAETSTTSVATTTSSTPPAIFCDNIAAGYAAPAPYSEAALDEFGPLEPAPSLTIAFGNDSGSGRRGVRATRIQGGVLVSASHSSTVPSTPQDEVPIVVVEHDGSVRWSRCLAGHGEMRTAVAAPALRPANALVMVLGTNAPHYESYFVQLSLATGASVTKFATAMESAGVDAAALGRLGIADSTDRFALLADNVSVLGGSYQHIVRYDLAADVAVDVGVPAELMNAHIADACGDGLQPALLSSGDVVVENVSADTVTDAVESINTGAVVARWHDGRWSNEPALLSDATAVRPAFSCDDLLSKRVLTGVDALGHVRWTDPQLTHPGADDIGWYVDGDVAVGQVCSQRTGDDCDILELVGIDPGTGAVRWTQPGLRLVAGDPSDGYALVWAEVVGDVLEPPGWVLLDDRTGREVAGQRWDDPEAFTLHPSREVDGYNRTTRAGGVVLVVKDSQVEVFYPEGAAGEPHRTVLPVWQLPRGEASVTRSDGRPCRAMTFDSVGERRVD